MKKVCVSGVGIVAVLFTLAAGVTLAAPSGDKPSQGAPEGFHCPGGPHHEFGTFLNLSKEQKEKMAAINQRFLASTRDLRYDFEQKRLEMHKRFTDPKTDDATLRAKAKELEALKMKLADSRIEKRLEWRKVLTVEQLQKLDALPRHGRGHDFAFTMR
jgi:Spy/CpxP family protein refolding chaperone